MRSLHSHHSENGLNKQHEQRNECACVWVVLPTLSPTSAKMAIANLDSMRIAQIQSLNHIVQMSNDTAQMHIFCNAFTVMMKQESGQKESKLLCRFL